MLPATAPPNTYRNSTRNTAGIKITSSSFSGVCRICITLRHATVRDRRSVSAAPIRDRSARRGAAAGPVPAASRPRRTECQSRGPSRRSARRRARNGITFCHQRWSAQAREIRRSARFPRWGSRHRRPHIIDRYERQAGRKCGLAAGVEPVGRRAAGCRDGRENDVGEGPVTHGRLTRLPAGGEVIHLLAGRFCRDRGGRWRALQSSVDPQHARAGLAQGEAAHSAAHGRRAGPR